jgi:hypothetical protein
MHRRFAVGFVVLLLCVGCRQPPAPALQPEDVVRPQVALAPGAFWPEGAKATVGALLEVRRPGREGVTFLEDNDVPLGAAVMRCKVTFLKGDAAVGEPLEVPFVHDC